MAEALRFADPRYGHAGILTYIPRDEEDPAEPGALHTSRRSSNAPYFKQIGSSAELYPASRSDPPQPTHSHRSAERNLQRRWLLKSHPAAFMGNTELSGLLQEDAQRFKKLDESPNRSSLIAIGDMLEFSNPARASKASVLAAATGESGELLRLVRVEDARWAWDDDKDTMLHLSVVNPIDQEDEVLWASDGLPITRIKFATALAGPDSIRWLLVQKATSTTILRPEYSKVPKSESQQHRQSRQVLSRINPTPLLNMGHKETGGNAHTDMAFNPPGDDYPPQICIIDECGYWTLWNIFSYRRTDPRNVRLSLFRCGHIFEGALDEIPNPSAYPAENHGALFVGASQVDDFWGPPSPDPRGSSGTAVRSDHLVLWNSERFEVVNTEKNVRLAAVAEFSSSPLKFGRILDIQLSSVNQNHILVLTARFIVWVDVLPTQRSGHPPKPAILLTFPHGMDGYSGLKLSVERSAENESVDPVAFVYSAASNQVSVNWFSFDTGNDLPCWHSQLVSMAQSVGRDGSPFTHQELFFRPSKLTCPSRASGTGSRYREKGVQFYQGMMLGSDLSVRYCMCFASLDPALVVSLPMNRLGWTEKDQGKRWAKKRRQILRYLGAAVVVPDSMTDEALQSLSRMPGELGEETGGAGTGGTESRLARPTYMQINGLSQAIKEGLGGNKSQPLEGFPVEVLDVLQEVVQDGSSNGMLPFMTWKELAKAHGLGGKSKVITDEELEETLQDLLLSSSSQTAVTQLARYGGREPTSLLGKLSKLRDEIRSIWLEPLEDILGKEALLIRESWVSELALEMFLSLHAITIQDTPLFGTESALPHQGLSSSIPPQSSQTTATTLPSSPPTSSPAPEPDAAFQRLKLLAPSLEPGKLGTSTRAGVLARWPADRGVDPRDYVSSVAEASDRKLDGARQRLQKIEAKRKALADKYKKPPSRRAGPSEARATAGQWTDPVDVPMPMGIMTSQQQAPTSSQSTGQPGLTMSQPVSGAFGGDRKKPKKTAKKNKKKKSGFR